MGRKQSGFSENSTLQDLNNKKIGTNRGTSSYFNLLSFKEIYGLDFEIIVYNTFPEALDNLANGNIDAVSTDGSGLYGNRLSRNQENNWPIFPKKPLSKEPLGPSYLKNDSKWATIVNWVVYSTILAEEVGLTSQNIDTNLAFYGPDIQRLFGALDTKIQDALGLDKKAFYNVIKQVGNYDEIYQRNLSNIIRPGTLNALYTDGGILYSPPVGFEGL